MQSEQIRLKLVENGVKNLKEWGYHFVNAQDILTDEVYIQFFERMLNENLGISAQLDEVINGLLQEIKNNQNA